MGAPWAASAEGAKAANPRRPFDCGTPRLSHLLRQGPGSIRRTVAARAPYESEIADFDIRKTLGLVDCATSR